MLSRFYRSFFTILLLISFDSHAIITLTDNDLKFEVGKKLEIYIDDDGQESFDEIRTKKFDSPNRLNFGITNSIYWVRFTVENLSQHQDWHLRVNYPPTDYIDFYSPNERTGTYTVIKTGDKRPFASRPTKNNFFLFPINPSNDAATYYARFETQSVMNLSMTLISETSLIETAVSFSYFQGVYFGILFVMALYNLFIYLSVRDKTYLYYVLFILCMGIFQLTVQGYGVMLVWPDWPWWTNNALIFGISLTLLFALRFTQSFLFTQRYCPKHHNAMQILGYGSLINCLLVILLPFSIPAYLAVFLGFLSSVAMASAGIASLKAGSRQARFYLAAWSVLLLSSFLFLFRLMGLLPSDWFTLYAVQIGSVIEAVLLSLGLADRINLLKAEALKTEQSANKLKDEFMSTITHELLTPVNGIRLSLDLLKDKFITSEDKQLYQTANDSNSHLLKLIESMFTFVEARRGSIKLEESLVRFKQSCENVFNYFHNSKKNGVSLDFIWDAQLPDYVLLDEKKFTLVLSQLMKNACSYTKSGSVVMSLTLEGDSHCRVSVKDTGIGIDSEKLDTLFEAFNQADNSLKREHGGLGIGLSLAKDILNLFNTKLELISEVGKGTRATFVMPLSLPSQEEIASLKKNDLASAQVAPNEGTKKSKILVVEDNPVNSKLLCKLLEKVGYSPLAAIHGEDAISILNEQNDIEAILMDCQMPVMDGYEATRIIRNHNVYSKIPIIAVTANVSTEDQQRCIDCGMDFYLAKPVRKEVLIETLTRYLNT